MKKFFEDYDATVVQQMVDTVCADIDGEQTQEKLGIVVLALLNDEFYLQQHANFHKDSVTVLKKRLIACASAARNLSTQPDDTNLQLAVSSLRNNLDVMTNAANAYDAFVTEASAAIFTALRTCEDYGFEIAKLNGLFKEDEVTKITADRAESRAAYNVQPALDIDDAHKKCKDAILALQKTAIAYSTRTITPLSVLLQNCETTDLAQTYIDSAGDSEESLSNLLALI